MTEFMKPDDPNAHLDFPGIHDKPEFAPDDVLCPVCKGYGGWNLSLNSYKLHNREDTPENRHRYSHFRASCSQCNGWGWTTAENAKCIHSMKHFKNTGRCLNQYKCEKCGKIEEIDSSD